MREFKSMLVEGKSLEKDIRDYLTKRGYEVKDVSDDDEYKDIDVDILARSKRLNRWIKIEVKNDDRMAETGNFFIEDGMDRSVGYREGWLYKCRADFLFYHDRKAGMGYIINWPKMQEDATLFPKRRFWNRYDNCYGYGYLVNVEKAKEMGLVCGQYKL